MTITAAASPAISQASTMTRTAAVSAVAETASAALAIPSVTPPSPAVVLSINPGTLSAVSHPGDKTAEQRVNSLAEAVKTHNDIADAVAQVDWAKFAKIAGPEKAEAEKMASMKYLAYSATRLGREFGESGIDVRAVTDEQAAATGQASGTLKVKDFTFKSGGSVYAVTVQEDGTLVGTRDGEAWKTWKTIPSHATRAATDAGVALAKLQGMLSPSGLGTVAGSLGLLSMSV